MRLRADRLRADAGRGREPPHLAVDIERVTERRANMSSRLKGRGLVRNKLLLSSHRIFVGKRGGHFAFVPECLAAVTRGPLATGTGRKTCSPPRGPRQRRKIASSEGLDWVSPFRIYARIQTVQLRCK